MKIGMTSIYVEDPGEAFRFYTDTLGFVEKMYMPEANLAIVASPQDPDGTALLLEPNENPIASNYQKELYNAGLPAIVLSTNDIDGQYSRLSELGVSFKKKPTQTDWGMVAIFDDGCGNWIQLFQDNN